MQIEFASKCKTNKNTERFFHHKKIVEMVKLSQFKNIALGTFVTAAA